MPSTRGFIRIYTAAYRETVPWADALRVWDSGHLQKEGSHMLSVTLDFWLLGREQPFMDLTEKGCERAESSREAAESSHVGKVHTCTLLQPKQMSQEQQWGV